MARKMKTIKVLKAGILFCLKGDEKGKEQIKKLVFV